MAETIGRRNRRDTFAAINHAATLLERVPESEVGTSGKDGVRPDRVAHVYLVLATFADGDTGRNARPSRATLAALTGLDEKTVQRALRRLVELGEIARTNGPAHRGSAACYSIELEKAGRLRLAFEQRKGDAIPQKAGRLRPTTSSDQCAPSLAAARCGAHEPLFEVHGDISNLWKMNLDRWEHPLKPSEQLAARLEHERAIEWLASDAGRAWLRRAVSEPRDGYLEFVEVVELVDWSFGHSWPADVRGSVTTVWEFDDDAELDEAIDECRAELDNVQRAS